MAKETVRLTQVGELAFGPGVARQAADALAARDLRRTLILTTPPIRCHAEALASEIRKAGVGAGIWETPEREPSVADFDAAVAHARATAADAVIGVGGGSVMDLAKLVAALADGAQQLQDVGGIGRLEGRALWLACVPTTAGTGSEVSPIAILLDQSDHLKKGVISPHLVPDAAYVDPLLTLTMPPSVTASTGLDALTHCIESYANRFAHPLVDSFALEGIRLISGSLLTAVTDGKNIAARTDMARGSLYGGMCLGPVNTAAVHALAYPFAGEFQVPHGVSNAVLLPHVLAFNLPAATARYADIGRAMGAAGQGSEEAVARWGLALVEDLCRQCGVPMRLAEHGVRPESIPRMADGAMAVTRLLDNNVRVVTHEDACRIYKEAL
ncbi:MAG: iron-containing alcohol dehydrogenase [Gammaproteobacteria bacterium]|nr:iron-containing alcohol dehydrogenase [Gammaproteobacteria bacterium]